MGGGRRKTIETGVVVGEGDATLMAWGWTTQKMQIGYGFRRCQPTTEHQQSHYYDGQMEGSMTAERKSAVAMGDSHRECHHGLVGEW